MHVDCEVFEIRSLCEILQDREKEFGGGSVHRIELAGTVANLARDGGSVLA